MKKVSALAAVKLLAALVVVWYCHGTLLHGLTVAGMMIGIIMVVAVAFGPSFFAKSFWFSYSSVLLAGVASLLGVFNKVAMMRWAQRIGAAELTFVALGCALFFAWLPVYLVVHRHRFYPLEGKGE